MYLTVKREIHVLQHVLHIAFHACLPSVEQQTSRFNKNPVDEKKKKFVYQRDVFIEYDKEKKSHTLVLSFLPTELCYSVHVVPFRRSLGTRVDKLFTQVSPSNIPSVD